MDGLTWAIVLLLIGIGLLVLESLLPSGGLLGVLAAAAIFSAVVLAYRSGGSYTGTLFLMMTGVLIPALIALLVRLWPRTPIGRRILIPTLSEQELLPSRKLQQLVGKEGRATTPMLPSGAIRVEGRTYDAVSQGRSIEAGTPIKVIAFTANHLVVRPIGASDNAVTDRRSDDALAQPADQIVPDPFEDPLT